MPRIIIKLNNHLAMAKLMAPQDDIVSKAKAVKPGPRHWWRATVFQVWLASMLLGSAAYADLIHTALNQTGVVILTNAEVQTGELDLSNLRAIFTIRKRNWDDKTPIKVFVLPDQNPLHQRFCKSVLKVYPYVLREQWDRLIFSGTGIPPTIVNTEQELRAIIDSTPGAIGYAMDNKQIDTVQLTAPSDKRFVLRTRSEY